MSKIAGVVIAYYPEFDQLLFNIGTYINHVGQLFIVFNSPVSSDEARRINDSYPAVQLICNNENVGIAAALNQSARKALYLGYEWLLTMDQDSYFPSHSFFEHFNTSNDSQVAIYCPNSNSSIRFEGENTGLKEEVLYVITSGNLLNLLIWKTIGGFEEKLFIDEVDHDYCLKAISRGYKIVQFKNIPLIHELGKKKKAAFFLRKYIINIHPPIRAYYIFRNNLYIFSKYRNIFPQFTRSRKSELFKSFVKIILFSNERLRNCRYIFLGIKDYANDRYGRYDQDRKIGN